MAKNITEDKIFNKFLKILVYKLKLKENEVTRQSHIVDDIGIDSVDFWEVIAQIEQDFEIDVKDDDVKSVNTVQDVIDLLKTKIGQS